MCQHTDSCLRGIMEPQLIHIPHSDTFTEVNAHISSRSMTQTSWTSTSTRKYCHMDTSFASQFYQSTQVLIHPRNLLWYVIKINLTHVACFPFSWSVIKINLTRVASSPQTSRYTLGDICVMSCGETAHAILTCPGTWG